MTAMRHRAAIHLTPEEARPMALTITKATKAGGLRSGGDSHGAVIHLIENPDSQPLYNLGAALCGAEPRIMWSDWVPESGKVCPKCQRKLDQSN